MTAQINVKAQAHKEVFATAAVNFAATKAQALSAAEQAQSDDEKSSFIATAKTAQTHERYSAALSDMSEAALKLITRYSVDAEALSKQARELKKRSIAILEAIASKQKVNDRALDAVLQFIVAKDVAAMTLDQVQHQMQHQTTTQAQYFKTCAVFFNFATYSKSEKTITLNKEARILKDLLALYATAE